LTDAETGHQRDIWGIESKYVPAAHGGNWEPICSPLANVEDPAALRDYSWPRTDWFDFSALDAELEAHKDYAIMTAPGVDSPTLLGIAQDLLGIERAMMDMILRPEFFQAVLDRILEFFMAFVEQFFAVAGDRVDFFRIGDDFGTQRGLLIGPAHWRRFIQPALRELSAVPKKHGALYYHHSCGAVRELIPLLIETGVDVLDPMQVKAEGMSPAELKADFGRRICFSGGVDEQELLPRGTPEEVRSGVRALMDVMSPGGGYFLGPTHNFQPDIPTENIVAMYEAARNCRY
jgi:uroporphyrinogen decarboxylase